MWFDKLNNRVRLIEQRLLPHQFKIVSTKNYLETSQAIKNMVVRGAGAIGATAAYGLAQGAQMFQGNGIKTFDKHIDKVYRTLAKARPTAIDPINAMQSMLRKMSGPTVSSRKSQAIALAEQFATMMSHIVKKLVMSASH